ncbi:VRR-NUC domain-containing protein [Clostridia bacterium]|nr:VRR-NUC domain-containing protein [Clostridia bacterium]
MREKTIEQKLVQAVKAVGGIAPKFTSPGFDGMPDRLILLPRGKIAFVEVKWHGEKPRPLQEARHGLLRRLGFAVYVLDEGAQIGEILEQIGGGAECLSLAKHAENNLTESLHK